MLTYTRFHNGGSESPSQPGSCAGTGGVVGRGGCCAAFSAPDCACATADAPINKMAAATILMVPMVTISSDSPVFPHRTRRMPNEEVTNRQIVEVTLEKGAYRIVRRADDRLFVHVEAGVDD